MKNSFKKFFKELHGYEPFPWQSRLADLVLSSGWPKNISLPTASGKTACIDIHVFCLACSAIEESVKRQPRRLWFVVDRRLVVDEANERASHIASKLLHSSNGILKKVADALSSLSSSEIPLSVSKLRGGSVIDNEWSSSIDQPTILTSTVDQCGSRMLFRGYGVSQYSRPIHAAFAGVDSLILVDEAHLSEPFIQTAKRVSELTPNEYSNSVIELSATGKTDELFTLGEDDQNHPILSKRIKASKKSILQKIKVKKDDPQNYLILADKIATSALKLSKTASIVGCVCNSVKGARAVFEQLNQLGCEGVLLTGRCRSIERDELLKEHLEKFTAGKKVERLEKPFFVVATQCVEVGANLDFDALVTEIAPLDSLRQRFGRLNRLGEKSSCNAVICGTTEQLLPHFNHPVYRKTLSKTWKWLDSIQQGQGQKKYVDFGIESLSKHMNSKPPNLSLVCLPKLNAPLLMQQDLDLISKTNIQTPFDDSIPLFLHGEYEVGHEVNIVWRSDFYADQEAVWGDCASLLPPGSQESLSIPIWVAKSWLASQQPADVFDNSSRPNSEAAKSTNRRRFFVLWNGKDEVQVTDDLNLIKPGMTVMVPSFYGGCDQYGWNPVFEGEVRDFAEESYFSSKGKHAIRLIKGWTQKGLPDELEKEIKFALRDDNTSHLRNFLQKAGFQDKCSYPRTEFLQHSFLLDIHPTGKGFVAKENKFADRSKNQRVILQDHCKGVSDIAKLTSRLLKLSDDLVHEISRATNNGFRFSDWGAS